MGKGEEETIRVKGIIKSCVTTTKLYWYQSQISKLHLRPFLFFVEVE